MTSEQADELKKHMTKIPDGADRILEVTLMIEKLMVENGVTWIEWGHAVDNINRRTGRMVEKFTFTQINEIYDGQNPRPTSTAVSDTGAEIGSTGGSEQEGNGSSAQDGSGAKS